MDALQPSSESREIASLPTLLRGVLPLIASMHPLENWDPPANLIGLFTDIDDTLTTGGAVAPDAMPFTRAGER